MKEEMIKNWEDGIEKPYMPKMPFMPSDKYVTMQNPPDFTWSQIKEAEEYELAVAKDRALSEICFSAKTTDNYYNFDTPFEFGVKYYWAVRYKKEGEYSDWSHIRRFRISPHASVFTVPHDEGLYARVPKNHPRICTTSEKLCEFRALKDENETARKIFEFYRNRALKYLETNVIEQEPVFESSPDWVVHSQLKLELGVKANRLLEKAFTCGFVYLISGEKEIGEFGVKALLSVSGWDIYGATSYKNQDQVHRMIAYKSAMAYDWLYDLMSEDERVKVREMVRERVKVMEYLLGSLKASPYDSHGWTAFGFIGICAIALFGEVPEAEGWLKAVVPAYSAILPPWSYEDGGWAQGTGYWTGSTGTNKEFMDILIAADIINLYNKAWAKHEYLWSLYAIPYEMYGTFGNSSAYGLANDSSKTTMYRDACYAKNTAANGLAKRWGKIGTSQYFNYNVTRAEDCESTSVDAYPLSHEFKDIGWITFSNDIRSPESVFMTFKSSPYGSFNHSHADQNAFVLQAYGDRLAVNAGYYDAYCSKHDSGFTRRTIAHNSVTLGKSRGQKDMSMYANGELNAYLTHPDFDLGGGEAKNAYEGALERFDRSVIYLRPDIFVIIDDLKSAGEPCEFEWWLNAAEKNIELTEVKKGAKITSINASLDATVHYPDVQAEIYNDFCGSDLNVVPPAGRFKPSDVQGRACFTTESTLGTKMVVSLDVHKTKEDAREIKCERKDNCLKLSYEGGRVVYVNLGENTDTVKIDGYEFVGKAVAVCDTAIMLVRGTKLYAGGERIFEFEGCASALAGRDELSISTYDDNTVTVGTGNKFIDKIEKITDYYGYEASEKIGIQIKERDENSITLSLDKDNYSLMLNGKLVNPTYKKGNLTLTIDGEEQSVELDGASGRDGVMKYYNEITVPLKKYKIVNSSSTVNVEKLIYDDGVLTNKLRISSFDEESSLELASAEMITAELEIIEDEGVKEGLSLVKNAYEHDSVLPKGTLVNAAPGGASIKGPCLIGTRVYYDFELSEDGEYDLVFNCIVPTGLTRRCVSVDGKNYYVEFPNTKGAWKNILVRTGAKLSEGKHRMYVECGSHEMPFGTWQNTWIGFIKR